MTGQKISLNTFPEAKKVMGPAALLFLREMIFCLFCAFGQLLEFWNVDFSCMPTLLLF